MESISRLREYLLSALRNCDALGAEQELFDELMVQKSRLLRLLDVGPRNPQEQREIESGKTTIRGKQVAVNSEFARQAVFLSQQLDCSERYAAELLDSVTAGNPNVDSARSLELVVQEFHHRRRALVDCLLYLFQAAEASLSPDAPQTYVRLLRFAEKALFTVDSAAGGETFVVRMIKESENLDAAILKADAARRNAGSNTVAPSSQGTPSLSYDTLNSRYESLKYERRSLAIALCTISRMGYFSSNDLKAIVEWLATNPNHALTFYMLTAFLSSLDPADPESRPGERRRALAKDASVVTFMTQKLSPASAWKELGLKATVLLKWTLFLTHSRHHDSSLEHRAGFGTEELETQIWNAVQGDAFTYLASAGLQLYKKRSIPAALLASTLSLSTEQQEQRGIPVDDFIPVVLSAFEILIRSLITHASSELRKIKQRQEDLVLASARTDRSRVNQRFSGSHAHDSDKPHPPRNDIATLFSFIGMLYSALPPERALQYWGSGPQTDVSRMSYPEYVETAAGRLPTFLQWAVWSTSVHDPTMSTALYDMLAGLAKGQQCSELAYNFMARGGGEVIPGSMLPTSSSSGPSVSWMVVFGILESWASAFSNPRGQQQTQTLNLSSSVPFGSSSQAPQQVIIGPKEVLLAQSFLQLLATVVTHSVAVRVTISSHAHFRAIPTLVSLVPLGIPLELKGSLFKTLAAFCEPGAGAPGIEICKAVWTLLERLEVINVRVTSPNSFGPVLPSAKGVEAELEEIEAPHRLYPATIPFLVLLSTLIHTPKRIPLRDRIADVQPINTIPESLGHPYRLPGIAPFTAFVIDNVFANIPNREYARPSDRWLINDLCLCYIERALASYDLEYLVNTPQDVGSKGDSFVHLLVHPGYDIMKRLLSNSPFQANILSYLVDGVEGFEKDFASEEPYFRSTIVRVLRIVHRVLEIQDIFLDVLIPLLSEFDSVPVIGVVQPRSYFTRFDQALSFGHQYIPSIAAYMAYPSHSELVLLSVKIVTQLSLSTSLPNLATLIEKSPDSERVLGGFRQIMETESMDDALQAETIAEEITGAGAPDVGDEGASLAQAIRVAALDLLILQTESGRPFPNIAHFLLFGESSNGYQIQDPHALGARSTSIHVILDVLNTGVPRLKGKGKGRCSTSQAVPFMISLPSLAERCYRLIHQLCTHTRTSDFMTRYLRTREDFFARQLAFVPSKVPQASEGPFIQVLYNDGSRTNTTVSVLSSFLRLRSYIFDLVALELHILTNKAHFKAVSELLDILFGNDSGIAFETSSSEDDFIQPFEAAGQSHIRIIEFLQSLMFEWSDSLTVQPVKLQFLEQLNLQMCIRTDSRKCEIVDRNILLSLLSAVKRALHAQGAVVTAAQVEQLQKESSYVLESCAVENHRREVTHAISTGFESWRRLLDMALMKCFDRLPHERRENMLFDLLHVLPLALHSGEIEEPTAVLLSEAILSSITKLREDRRHQIIAQSAGGDIESGSLPTERLCAILRNILEGILDNNRVELVRGNLYAALVNYIHLILLDRSHSEDGPSTSGFVDDFSSLSSMSFGNNQSLLLSTALMRPQTTDSNLEVASLAVVKGVVERLVGIVSRDAIDGTEVWKTIAFMLLDALVQLSGIERHHIMLPALTRYGVLTNFVRGVKESDGRLLSVLKPDPDDLNPLYVYEAKMSLFVRMSQTRSGAERLLEAQLIPILAQCDYLDARPEADQSFMDLDSFLPSAIQRYHQLLMPALQVVDGMLATLGSKHATVAHQALDFLSNHSATIVILLKNDGDYVPLALLEEIHLIVTFCTTVLPSVPKTELVSTNTGFGAIHAAILSLATQCLGTGQCFPHIIPQSDVEVLTANTRAFGYESFSKFEINVRQRERLLRKSVVSYIGATSEFTEPEITLVLSPITTTPRQDERGSHFLATLPTIGSALEGLNNLCKELMNTLKQITDISAELSSREHIGIESINEVIKDIHASFLHNLDIGQKRALICQELENVKTAARRDARLLLDTIEMLLLLLWRHIDHYASPSSVAPQLSSTSVTAGGSPGLLSHSLLAQNATARSNMNTAMRFLAAPDPETFKVEVGKKLGPALAKLANLELNAESVGQDWQANQAYLDIMSRRLRDSIGMHDREAERADEDMQ